VPSCVIFTLLMSDARGRSPAMGPETCALIVRYSLNYRQWDPSGDGGPARSLLSLGLLNEVDLGLTWGALTGPFLASRGVLRRAGLDLASRGLQVALRRAQVRGRVSRASSATLARAFAGFVALSLLRELSKLRGRLAGLRLHRAGSLACVVVDIGRVEDDVLPLVANLLVLDLWDAPLDGVS
jgi:hypothetical protein